LSTVWRKLYEPRIVEEPDVTEGDSPIPAGFPFFFIIAERWEHDRVAIQKSEGCYRFQGDQDTLQPLE